MGKLVFALAGACLAGMAAGAVPAPWTPVWQRTV